MRGTSTVVGVGPTSSSQHVASRSLQLRLPSAERRGSSSAHTRRPSLPFSAPPIRQKAAEGVAGLDNHRSASSENAGPVPAEQARKILRAASANPTRHVNGRSPVSAHAGHDVAYLYQQLQDTLQQQTRAEEERQRQLMVYRRQLRRYYDSNAILRNIIQAGEARRRDEAIALADVAPKVPTTTTTAKSLVHTNTSGVGAAAASGPLRAHSRGTSKGPASVTEAELEVVEQRIHLTRQRHNRLLHEVRVNTAALLKDEQAKAMITAEAGASLDPASLLMGANRPVYLRLMRLEHLLNEVLRKQSTVGVVLKNYRYHLTTLRSEAARYDVQQRMLENEYADRHRDHLQLLDLYETARAAYASAVDARAALQQSGAKMRHAKEKALSQRRKEVEKELADTQLQERRVVDLQQQLEEESQLLEAAENTKAQLEKQRLNSRAALTLLKATSTSREGAGAAASGVDGQLSGGNADERVSAFEVAFRDMMQVAHVDTLDALVETYQAEMEQQCKLQDDLDGLRDARASLRQETATLRDRLKQTKYCVGAGTRFGAAAADNMDHSTSTASGGWKTTTAAVSPLMEREMETFLREEKATLTLQIKENELNQSLLMEVAERMNRLSSLVAEYRADVRLPAIRLSPALSTRSSTLPLHAAVLAQKLLALASDAAPHDDNDKDDDGLTTATTTVDAASSLIPSKGSGGGALSVVSSTQLVIPANNRRVPLPHERGVGGGVSRSGVGGGAFESRARFSADVAGISSTAARALLNGAAQPVSSLSASPDYVATNVRSGFQAQRKRRSSASAGAGFIEGEDDDDDAQLATVAALPPPGGRVLDFDLDSSGDSDGRGVSDSSSDRVNNGELRENCNEGGEAGERDAATLTRRRRSSAKAGLAERRSGVISSNLVRGANLLGGGGGGGDATEDDQEDPLRRDEVKRMSEMIQERRKRDSEEERSR